MVVEEEVELGVAQGLYHVPHQLVVAQDPHQQAASD